jgi:hypothetical protein
MNMKLFFMFNLTSVKEFAGALSFLFEEEHQDPQITAAWLANVDSSNSQYLQSSHSTHVILGLQSGSTHEYVKYRYAWGIKR